MTFLDVVVYALVQGLAEVLPLGASGHLALLPHGASTPEGRAAVSVAAHAGVVAALLLYFWRDWLAMGRGVVKLAKGRPDPGGRLLLLVLAGTVPALALSWGFLALGGGGPVGKVAVASAMLVFGFLLLVADRLGVTVNRIEHLGYGRAVLIGVLQAAALIPGVSRMGITLTAARLMGFERHSACRFSLLLATPLFAGHALLTTWKLSAQAQLIFSPDLAVAAVLSLVAALLALAGLMAWVRRNGFAPFALWRMGVGVVVLVLAFLQ